MPRARRQTKPKPKSKRLRVTAGPCPEDADHGNGNIYKTRGQTRYCQCRKCPARWNFTGPPPGATEREWSMPVAPCPRNKHHRNVRVCSSLLVTAADGTAAYQRACKCNDCGAEWRETVEVDTGDVPAQPAAAPQRSDSTGE